MIRFCCKLLVVVALTAAVSWSGACLAQEQGPTRSAEPAEATARASISGGKDGEGVKPFPDGLKVQVHGEALSQSRIKGEDAKFSVFDSGASVTYSPMAALSFSAGYEHRYFDRQNYEDAGFGDISGDPWTNLNRIRVNGVFRDTLGERWFFAVRAVATSSFEEEMDGSFGGGGGGMVGYKVTDSLDVGVGGVVFANAIRVRPIPSIFLRYKPDFGLEVGVGSQGVSVGYHFTDWLFVNAAASRSSRFYRLSNDNLVAGKGYVEMSDWQGGLFADVSCTDDLALTVGLAYVMKRDIKVYDEDGDRRYDRLRVKPGYGGQLGLTYKF